MNKDNKSRWLLLAIGVITISFMCYFACKLPFNDGSGNRVAELFAQYGTFIGGTLGTLLTFGTIIFLIIQNKNQREHNNKIEKSMEAQNQLLKNEIDTNSKQIEKIENDKKFENLEKKYFRLLEQLDELLKSQLTIPDNLILNSPNPFINVVNFDVVFNEYIKGIQKKNYNIGDFSKNYNDIFLSDLNKIFLYLIEVSEEMIKKNIGMDLLLTVKHKLVPPLRVMLLINNYYVCNHKECGKIILFKLKLLNKKDYSSYESNNKTVYKIIELICEDVKKEVDESLKDYTFNDCIQGVIK